MPVTKSIRFKLMVLVLVFTILPAILFYMIYTSFVKEIITKKYSQTAIQSVFEASENLDFKLNDIVDFSNVMLTSDDFISSLSQKRGMTTVDFKNLLRSFFASREDIDGIYIYDSLSFNYAGAIKTEEQIRSSKGSIESTDGEVIWLNTLPARVKILSGEFTKYFFSLGRKIIDFNTFEMLGFMTIDIDETVLEDSYRNLMEEKDVEVFVCTADGVIISHPNKSMIGLNIRPHAYSKDVLDSDNEKGYVTFTENDVETIAIYAKCNISKWRLIKIIPTDFLYKEIMQMQRNILSAGVACVLLAIFVALLFSLRMTKPMVNLMAKMKRVERGDWNVRIEDLRDDEIGQLGASFNQMISKTEVLITKLVEEERQKKEIEIEALHAQINPHFLYNTLNTIKWMAKIQGDKSVSSALTALIKLLRISINLGKDMISLEEEIDYVKNYILIQNLRFNENLSVDYDIADISRTCFIPKLILQPIVENSIIYGTNVTNGTEDIKNKLKICISTAIKDDLLTIVIEDNGPGIAPDVLAGLFKTESGVNRFSKVGLNNVNQRIKMYCGDGYGVSVESTISVGTKVTVQIPALFEKPKDSRGEHSV